MRISFVVHSVSLALALAVSLWGAGCSSATPVAPIEDAGKPFESGPDAGPEDSGADDAGFPDAGSNVPPGPGEEDGPCYGNGTCNANLVCEAGVCTAEGPPAGAEGGACYGNGTCDGDLICGEADICLVRESGPGEEGGPCYGNSTCNAGLLCQEALCVPDDGEPTEAPEILNLEATPATIDFGSFSVLSWVTSGASSCTFSPDLGDTDIPLSGTRQITPEQDTLYTLTCTNEAGSASASVSVVVNPPVRILSFTSNGQADPLTVDSGAVVTLAWTTEHASSCALDAGVGAVQKNGSTVVQPTENTTYTLTCQGVSGPVTAELVVAVNPGVEIQSFLANGESGTLVVDAGSDVVFTWTAIHADECAFDEGDTDSVAVPADGQRTVSFLVDRSASLTCTGVGGPVTATISIQVNPPVKVLTFTATPATIDYGQFTILAWTTEHADACRIEADVEAEDIGTVAVNGTTQATPGRSVTYELICEGVNGPARETLDVQVNPPVIIESFTASQSTGSFLGSVSLSWVVRDATSCEMDQGIGSVGFAGTRVATIDGLPGAAQVWTLTCDGVGGPVTKTVSVDVENQTYVGNVTVCGPHTENVCIQAGPTLAQLKTYNTIQGDVNVIGTTAADFVWPKLVTVTGKLVFSINLDATNYVFENLRSVGDRLAIGCDRWNYDTCDVSSLRFPRLEDVGENFATYDIQTPILSAPALRSVGGDLVRHHGESQCTSVDFSSLETVQGKLSFFVTKTANFPEAFPALQSIGGDLSVAVEYSATQPEVDAAFAGVSVGGTTLLEGATENTCD